jgi:mannan endo-1,4-beta-mannosidase
MKSKWYFLFILGMAILVAWPSRTQAATGFHISGRYLLDANGSNFIMRGINHPHTWYPTQTSSFANIKAASANTIRVVLSGGGRWTKNDATDVANVIQLCKSNHLICVLEDHDTTGYGEDSAAVSLASAVSYWKEIQSVLTGQEAYVIINIGNEPYGNINPTKWIADTKNAIAAMRSAGFHHTLMIDAPNWGQDWQFIMRNNAASIFANDPDRNLIFSIHMYSVFNTASAIQSYITTFVNNGLPLVIGEFGWNQASGDVDENSVMSYAQTYGIGYMGWSWSGNSGGAEYLDMVTNFDPSQRTSWGTRIITGANGLQQTSVEASVYSGILPTPTPAPPAAPTNLAAKTISKSQINLTWTAGDTAQQGFMIESCSGAGCTNFAQIATVASNVTSYSNIGLTASTSYSYRVRAYNVIGNSDYSNTATAMTQAAPAVPNAPTNLAATVISKSQINLAWTDNSSNETGFRIQRCKGSTCTNFALIATVGAGVQSYSNTGLTANTTYRYRIYAYNSVGNSGYSNIVTAMTKAR